MHIILSCHHLEINWDSTVCLPLLISWCSCSWCRYCTIHVHNFVEHRHPICVAEALTASPANIKAEWQVLPREGPAKLRDSIRKWRANSIRKFQIGRTCRVPSYHKLRSLTVQQKASTFAPFVVEIYVYNSILRVAVSTAVTS